MRLAELLEQAKGTSFAELEISGVTDDSRKAGPGFAFVCIEGLTTDGHKYAAGAAGSGAAVIIAQRDTGVPNQILVADTRLAYSAMCAAYFGDPAKGLHLIGITGTNGKTTTSYLLKSIFEKAGYKVGLIGTIQNMIGEETLPAKNTTPDAYELNSLFSLMKKSGCSYVVMEVSSHALEQGRTAGLHFDTGVFTNLTRDHLDYHGTMENYLAAKRKLFEVCDLAVVNADDPSSGKLLEGLPCRRVSYSARSGEADYSAHNIVNRPGGVDFELVGLGVIGRVRFGTPGAFSVYNALAAGVAAVAMGLPFAGVVDWLSEAGHVKGRMETVETGRDFSIIIDYAHTPDGLENVLTALRGTVSGRLVAVFGCGGDRDRTKRPIMGEIAARLSDYVIVTSDNPRSEDPGTIIEDILKGMEGTETPFVVYENRAEAIRHAVGNARPGDVIVLAGKGHETYQILSTGTVHLDEREIAAEALAALDS
jgi:UDP-N-acetylmuramoyl-L-alanyl-D-glutamate--2,6-diaminopimelate ligase